MAKTQVIKLTKSGASFSDQDEAHSLFINDMNDTDLWTEIASKSSLTAGSSKFTESISFDSSSITFTREWPQDSDYTQHINDMSSHKTTVENRLKTAGWAIDESVT